MSKLPRPSRLLRPFSSKAELPSFGSEMLPFRLQRNRCPRSFNHSSLFPVQVSCGLVTRLLPPILRGYLRRLTSSLPTLPFRVLVDGPLMSFLVPQIRQNFPPIAVTRTPTQFFFLFSVRLGFFFFERRAVP